MVVAADRRHIGKIDGVAVHGNRTKGLRLIRGFTEKNSGFQGMPPVPLFQKHTFYDVVVRVQLIIIVDEKIVLVVNGCEMIVPTGGIKTVRVAIINIARGTC